MTKYFTIYWLDGKRTVVTGDTIEQAFTNAGYGAGAVRAVDFYDTKVSETHYWNKQLKSWEPFTDIKLQRSDGVFLKPFDQVKDLLARLLLTHHGIRVEFPDKNIMCIEFDRHDEVDGVIDVQFLKVYGAEYQEGRYDAEFGDPIEEGEHHYQVCGIQYFDYTVKEGLKDELQPVFDNEVGLMKALQSFFERTVTRSMYR